MGLRHWTAATTPYGVSKQHNIFAHDQLTRAHIAWFWLLGPGSSPTVGAQFFEGPRTWDTNQERKIAERACRTNAWSEQTLRDVHLFVLKLRDRPARAAAQGQERRGQKRPARGRRDIEDEFESSDEGLQSELLPTVERDWPPTFDLTREQRAEMVNKALNRAVKFVPPPKSNKHISHPQAVVLFDGDDQGNERQSDRFEDYV